MLASPECRARAHDLSWDCSAGTITLRMGEQPIAVKRTSVSCRELKPTEYYLHDMPETALTAAVALHDGAGDEVYVTTDGESLILYHRYITRAEPILPYREIKRVRIQRTTI